MFWQDGHLAKNQGQFPIVGLRKVKADPVTVFNGDLVYIRVVVAVKRVAFGGQNPVGKLHVFSGDWFTVLEAGLFIQIEDDKAAVFRHFNGLGNQPIFGKRLVGRRLQKGIVHVCVNTRRRDAPDDKGVKTIEAVGNHR